MRFTLWIANTEIGLDHKNSVIKRLWCTYFVKSTPLRAFTGSFQHCAEMLDILKKFDAEKIFFLQTDRVFNLAIFRQLHVVNNS